MIYSSSLDWPSKSNSKPPKSLSSESALGVGSFLFVVGLAAAFLDCVGAAFVALAGFVVSTLGGTFVVSTLGVAFVVLCAGVVGSLVGFVLRFVLGVNLGVSCSADFACLVFVVSAFPSVDFVVSVLVCFVCFSCFVVVSPPVPFWSSSLFRLLGVLSLLVGLSVDGFFVLLSVFVFAFSPLVIVVMIAVGAPSTVPMCCFFMCSSSIFVFLLCQESKGRNLRTRRRTKTNKAKGYIPPASPRHFV